MRNSVASAPRSTVPPINGSGSLQLSAGLRSSAPAPSPSRLIADGGANTRSIASSTSLASGSSVTTQAWPTVADTRPRTRSPLPCRVTSKLACRRGKSRSPAIRAAPARTSALATRSRCCPVSGTFSNASGTCHGVRPPFSDRGSRMGKGLRVGKSHCPGHQSAILLGIQLARRGACVTREPRGSLVHADHLEDIACERLLKLLRAGGRKRGAIGSPAAVKCLAETLHPFWHRQVADAHLAQVVVEILAERVEQLLSEAAV